MQFYNESAYVMPGSDVYYAISFLNAVQPKFPCLVNSLRLMFGRFRVLSIRSESRHCYGTCFRVIFKEKQMGRNPVAVDQYFCWLKTAAAIDFTN